MALSPSFSPSPTAVSGGSGAGSSAGLAGLGPGPAITQWADDAWRQLRTPGAYESWHFEAIDAAGNGVRVTIFDGYPFHPTYLHQLSRYRQRLAASTYDSVWDDIQPARYPVAAVSLYQGGKVIGGFVNQYPAGSFEGNHETPELRVGPNRITLRADGSFGLVARGYPFRNTIRGPAHETHRVLSVQLDFAPTFHGVQQIRRFRPDSPNGARHGWVLAAPHGRMTGRVSVIQTNENLALLDMPIDTIGYHDHKFGGSSIGDGIKKIIWGRASGPGFTAAWNHTIGRGKGPRAIQNPSARQAQHADSLHADTLLLFQKGLPVTIIESPAVEIDRWRVSPWLMRYPGRLTMHGSDTQGNSVELIIDNGSIMEHNPFAVRIAGQMSLTVVGKRQLSATGTMEIASTRRLLWPFFNEIGLLSILRIDRDDPIWTQ